jgi:hypothetical protein
MKANSRLLRTWAVLGTTLLAACGLWSQDGVDCYPIPDADCSLEVPLLAGQYVEVGSVVVQSSGTMVCVTYELSEDALLEGWLLHETHLAITATKEDIPQTKGNKWGTNPIPGHFPYCDTFVEGVPCWSVCIDVADLGLEEGDVVTIAAHAVVGMVLEDQCFVTETAWGEGMRFNERGNWGMYFSYTLCQPPVIVTSYIGYEDIPSQCDFDYNDFGMDMTVRETYDGDILKSIEMEFKARVNRAENLHDIHILRPLTGDYTYSVARSEAAFGNEEPEGTDIPGSGDFDVVLFDTEAWPNDDTQLMGQEVHIMVVIDENNLANTKSDVGPAPRFDLSERFSLYEPWMHNRSSGAHIMLANTKPAVSPLPSGGYMVPCIIVIPTFDWPHPDEGVTITGPYPLFDDYYSTQLPMYADWWEVTP